MKVRWLSGIVAGLILFGIVGLVQASFTHVGFAIYEVGSRYEAYGLIYDDDMQLIWMDSVNPPATWSDQLIWVDGLNRNENFYALWLEPGVAMTWTGEWRLPNLQDFTDLSNSGAWHQVPEANLFTIWRPSDDWRYASAWAADEPWEPDVLHYRFRMQQPSSYPIPVLYESEIYVAVAVRAATVAAVPLPAPIILIASGLAGIGIIRRNRARRLLTF